MNRITKIATGVDFAPESLLAADQAAHVARHVGAELLLVHVAPTLETPPWGRMPERPVGAPADAWAAPSIEAARRSRDKLARLQETLRGDSDGSLAVSRLIVEGYADERLCDTARSECADLVVVGTHGRTGLRWFLLGSVAEMVVRMAHADVLVARGARAGRGGFRRILVATDLSPASDGCLARALLLAAADATIDVVHCYGPPPGIEWGEAGAAIRQAVVEAARAQAGDQVESALRSGVKVLFHATHDRAIPGLIHGLESHPFDLAVVGSHGRRGFHRAILGSVAEQVARRAPCSVLVARPRARG